MLVGILVVSIGIHNMLLYIEISVQIVEDSVHVEGCWHFVTLRWHITLVIGRDKFWQTFTVGDKMTADVFSCIRQALSCDKNWTVGRGQIMVETSVIFVVSFTVAGPVRLWGRRLTDCEKALHCGNLVEFFELFSLAIEQDLVLIVILSKIDMVLVIRAQNLLQLIVGFLLYLAPLRSHNLEEDPLAQIDRHYMLATFRFFIFFLILLRLSHSSSRLDHLLSWGPCSCDSWRA